MNARFKLDGCYELEINGDGHYVTADGLSGGCSAGVAMLLHHTPLSIDEPAKTNTVGVFTLKRSQVRAIASAMLSAATEARA